MRNLLQVLQDLDRGALSAIAELWGLDPPRGPLAQAAATLAGLMLEPEALRETYASLSPPARQGLDELLRRSGRMPLADFQRRFGPIREMGPARRDRELPWRHPASPAEELWYRGLIARGFADTAAGPLEFAFVPSELPDLLPRPPADESLPGLPGEAPSELRAAGASVVDDATTLLAAARIRPVPSPAATPRWLAPLSPHLFQAASARLLLSLLHDLGALGGQPMRPVPEAARAFLEAARAEAIASLAQAWLASARWNDLQHVPGLSYPHDDWPNDPRLARLFVVRLLTRVPRETWWSLDAFIEFVREQEPGFQRAAGDFDSWYVQDAATGAFLRGLEHWDAVDGALLRFLVTGPLHWLGAVDLGTTPGRGGTLFRLTGLSPALFGEEPMPLPVREAPARLDDDGLVAIPALASRILRYQAARFLAWEGLDGDTYRYRLAPSRLLSAARQGLRAAHILTVLEGLSGRPLSPFVRRAVERCLARGREARLEHRLVLTVQDEATMRDLRRGRATARYLGRAVGPLSAEVTETDWPRLRRAALRMGLLIEGPSDRLVGGA